MRHPCISAALAALLATSASAALAASDALPDGVQAACAKDWSKVDANGDGEVTVKEAKAATEHNFGVLDTDGDGSVSLPEWRSCGHVVMLQSLGSDAAGGDNGSGEPAGSATSDEQASGQPAGSTGADVPNADVALGARGNGAANVPGNYLPWSEGIRFEDVDTDKSGDISREEAAAAAEKRYETSGGSGDMESAARASGAAFTQVDADGNGSISPKEFRARDSAGIDAGFAHIDADDNGKISRSEWLKARAIAARIGPVSVWRYYMG